MRNMVRLPAVAVAVGLALTAAPAQAVKPEGVEPQGGGGCLTRVENSWQIAICSADEGFYMYPDYYIDVRPPFSGTCQVRSYLYQEGAAAPMRPYEAFSCWTNHGVGTRYRIIGNPSFLDFYHRVRVVINGSTVFNQQGPATWCC